MRRTSLGLAAPVVLLAVAASVASAAEQPAASPSPSTVASEPAPAGVEPNRAFADRLEIEELVSGALLRNPELAAARDAWQAALARVPQASSLDDPALSYAIAPLSLGGGVDFGHELRLGQRLPWPGTLRLRRQSAAAEAAAAELRVGEVRLRLTAEARTLFAEYWRVSRSQPVLEDHLRLLGALKEVATARYAAGLVPQGAPLQAEVEATHAHHDAIELAAARERVLARLIAVLHLPPGSPLPPPADLPELPELAEAEAPAQRTEDAVAALAARPDLRARREEIAAKRVELTLRQRARYPELELMASYNSMWEDREHRLMTGVGVELPMRRQRRLAAVREAEAALAAAEAELASREDAALAEVAVARADLAEAEDEAALYRDRVLPASRDQLVAARAAFGSGTADMTTTIDAARNLRLAELEQLAVIAALATRRAELDRALGLPQGEASDENP